MAKTGDENQEALDIMSAGMQGISPKFMRTHDKLIEDARKILSDRLATNRTDNVVDVEKTSQSGEYAKIIMNAMRDADKIRLLKSVTDSNKDAQPSGAYAVSGQDNSIDKFSDNAVVTEIMNEVQSRFALMPEYQKVIDIIPELQKAIETIVRDIVNPDEFTQRFIKNFYNDTNEDRKSVIELKIKDLLDEYDFETRIKRNILTSEVCGCKPFSVQPQVDVISMINKCIGERKNMGMSHESIIPYDISEIFSEESFLVKSPLKPIYDTFDKYSANCLGIEGDEYIRTIESMNSTIESFTSNIITQDIIDQYVEICLEDFDESLAECKIEAFRRDKKDYNELVKSSEAFYKSITVPEHILKKNPHLRKQINDIVVGIDKSIEVVDARKGAMYQATKNIKNDNYITDKDSGSAIDDFYRVNDNVDPKTSKKDTKSVSINGLEIEINSNPIDPDQYAKAVKNRRAILTEYEPEHVIPISAGGVHIGYYIVEYIRTAGDNYLALKKDKGSFLDIIRRIGATDDAALLKGSGAVAADSNNPFSSGAFSPATIMSPSVRANGNSSFSLNGQSHKKVDLIKSILIKTLTKRLGENKLADSATFQSAMMNLIRDDIIFKNNIRFTFIPETHMVYMNRVLDTDGYPLSILNGTLFSCYTYISSMVSSLMMKVMKSSDTEVMEINMGKSKELGLTMASISKNASTRNVSARTLFGGTDSIVRNVGNFKRLLIPVVDGEKLFDVTHVEHSNNLDIDDDFTQKILKSIIMKIGVPPTTLDLMSQDEYVASQLQHRLDYRNVIVEKSVNYSKFVTKAIKLLVHYSDISCPAIKADIERGVSTTKNDKDELAIDIDNIDFKFSIPKHLTVSKISEELESISNLVDFLIKMYYGDATHEGKMWEAMVQNTRLLLMKELSSSTDWQRIEEVLDNAQRGATVYYAQMSKYDIDVVNDEESDAPNQDDGSGGGDSTLAGDEGGGSDGGDYGYGDDSGGGDEGGIDTGAPSEGDEGGDTDYGYGSDDQSGDNTDTGTDDSGSSTDNSNGGTPSYY